MSLNKALVLLFAVGFAASFASAQNCWERHNMPKDTINYEAWLCVNGEQHGSIDSYNPNHDSPKYGNEYLVVLDSFSYVSPYPATLFCYISNTGIENDSKQSRAVPKRLAKQMSWKFLAKVTLYAGQGTPSYSNWVQAGCPPISNNAQKNDSPPQVQIAVSWTGFMLQSRMPPVPREINPSRYSTPLNSNIPFGRQLPLFSRSMRVSKRAYRAFLYVA